MDDIVERLEDAHRHSASNAHASGILIESAMTIASLQRELSWARSSERTWEMSMMDAIGEDGPKSVAEAIQKLRLMLSDLAEHTKDLKARCEKAETALLAEQQKRALVEHELAWRRHLPVIQFTPVSDALPDEDGNYLCRFSDGSIETFTYNSENEGGGFYFPGSAFVIGWCDVEALWQNYQESKS